MPVLHTNTLSLGDEVRFRTSPDVIMAPPASATPPPPQRPAQWRPKIVVNDDGLLELDLSGRDLLTLPSTALRQFRVECLVASGNRLETLPTGLAALRRLRKLDVSNNRIRAIPAALSNCSGLRHLNIGDNRLSVIPAAVTQLQRLQVLRVPVNLLKSIPHELAELTALRQLDLSGNRLWHLPTALSRLTALQQLCLSDNHFETLPACVCELRQLRRLDISGNKIIELQTDIGNLVALQELIISRNRLVRLPAEFGRQSSLVALDASDNRLTSFPVEVARISHMRTLLLRVNRLTGLPPLPPSLRRLDVSANRLRRLNVTPLRYLRHLAAASNLLEEVPTGVYTLSDLQSLRLSGNSIEFVSHDIILLSELRHLDLSHNRLATLPAAIAELTRLRVFNVRGNPLEEPPPLKTAATMTSAMTATMPTTLNKAVATSMLSATQRRPARKRWRLPFWRRHMRNKTTLLQHRSTQCVPSSRGRPPLDYRPPITNNQTTPATHKTISSTRPSGGDLNNNNEYTSDYAIHSAIWRPSSEPPSEVTYPTATSATQRIPSPREGPRSDCVTINGSVGDCLSLGELEHAYQPAGVPDNQLAAVCRGVEHMLRDQLLQPVITGRITDVHRASDAREKKEGRSRYDVSHDAGTSEKTNETPIFTLSRGGIFRKSLNEGGTLRTLNGIIADEPRAQHPSSRFTGTTVSDVTAPFSEDIFARPQPLDEFSVHPVGGVFRSSTDSKVSVRFPPNAVSVTVPIVMQTEPLNQATLTACHRRDARLRTLLSVGTAVSVVIGDSADGEVHLNENVILTVAAPPAARKGHLHILTRHEGGSYTPSSAPYTVRQGRVAIETRQPIGAVAVLSKTKCKYKTCELMELLGKHLEELSNSPNLV